MRRLFEDHLKRVEWDEDMFPIRLYPFTSADTFTADHLIVIDPQVSFGRPVLLQTGVSIADRIDAGEAVEHLAADYELTSAEIEQAVLYERAA